MSKLISIVIPAYNEEKVIPELAKRLRNIIDNLDYEFEIIIVENGSCDNTLKALLKERKTDKRFKILQLVKNVGCDGGILSGLQYAKGDAAIIMMADLQDIPELIPKFIEKWKNGYEIVYGIVRKRKKVAVTRKIGTYFFYKIINSISDGIIPENASDFRLINKQVYSIINSMPEHNKFFRGIVSWTGFKQIGIPFVRPARYAGESKAYFKTVFMTAINALYDFSSTPTHAQWGMFIVLLILLIITFFIKSFNSQFIMFALILLNITMLIHNQYLIKIYEESRNRPKYIFRNKYGL